MASSNIHLLGKPVNDDTCTESCRFKVSCAVIKLKSVHEFPAFTTGEHFWFITCIPFEGDVADEIDYLGFWLQYGGEWKDVKVNFNIVLFKKDEASPCIKSKTVTNIFEAAGSEIGLEKFDQGDELRRYLKDDYFIVTCNITILSVGCMPKLDSGVTILSSLHGILKNYSVESSSKNMEMASGLFRFTVPCSFIKKTYWYFDSPYFMVGGHCWRIYFRKYETTLLLTLFALSAIKNLKVNLEIGVLKKDGSPLSPKWMTNTQHTFQKCGNYFLNDKFVEGDELKRYLQDDYFIVICNFTILSETITLDHEVTILGSTGKPMSQLTNGPTPSLRDDFSKLLENDEKTDVSIEVNGEIFHAHKFVLATRSTVFNAQLSSLVNENCMETIKVNGIEPRVFKKMLHFIYNDMLPELNDSTYCENVESNQTSLIKILEQLIVAGDCYALERLKLMCEDKLLRIKMITTDNVATTLVYAVRHNCYNLKARCIEFAASAQNFMKVSLTDGYLDLLATYPTVLKELRATFNNMNV